MKFEIPFNIWDKVYYLWRSKTWSWAWYKTTGKVEKTILNSDICFWEIEDIHFGSFSASKRPDIYNPKQRSSFSFKIKWDELPIRSMVFKTLNECVVAIKNEERDRLQRVIDENNRSLKILSEL